MCSSVPPPQQLNPAPVMAEPVPHVTEDFDWLSYLANRPAAQTNFESKVVVEDRNTKAPAAAAKAGGCVLGAAEGCFQIKEIHATERQLDSMCHQAHGYTAAHRRIEKFDTR